STTSAADQAGTKTPSPVAAGGGVSISPGRSPVERANSGHHAIAGLIGATARQLHAVLLDEGLQQLIQRLHDRRIAMDFIRAELLDAADALVLHVARDDAGKGTAQVGGQLVGRYVAAQLQVRHVLVGGVEGVLEALVDLQQPVEVE